MRENIQELINKFEKVKKIGWVKTQFKGTGSIGDTFEFLIDKNQDNFSVPDFNGIEIKTKNNNSKQAYIGLFTAIPYGKDFFEIQRLNNLYGYPDKDFKNFNVFSGDVFCKYKRKIGRDHYFSLKIVKHEKKVKLLVFNNNQFLIDDLSYWDLNDIKEKLIRKLTYLAVIKADRKVHMNKVYYKYTNLSIYKLKNFETFLKLLNQAKIKIQFRIGIFKSGPRFGQLHDRGTVFAIKEKYLLELYEQIY